MKVPPPHPVHALGGLLSTLVRLILLASLLIAAPALARPTARVQLPAGEDPALWAGPLAVAGLVEGAAGGEGEWIELVGGTGAWALRVQDRSGRLRQLAVEPPPDQLAREDLLWLALSLLRPAATVPSQPPAEPKGRRPLRSPRRPSPAPHRDAASPSPAPSESAGPSLPPSEPVRPSSRPAAVPSESVGPPPAAPSTPLTDPPPEVVQTPPPPADPPPSISRTPPPAADPPAESPPSSSVPPPPTRRVDPSVPSREETARWSGPRPRFYLGLATGVQVPLSSTPTPDLGIEGGLDFGGRARFGLRIESVAPTVLYAPADAQWMGGVGVQFAATFDVGRRRPIWLRLALGGHWLDLHGAVSRQNLNDFGMPGATTRLRAAGILGSVGLSVPWRLGESAVLAPYAVLEGGSYDPADVRAGADVLIPVSLRLGFEVVVMRHVGVGLPFPGRGRPTLRRSK